MLEMRIRKRDKEKLENVLRTEEEKGDRRMILKNREREGEEKERDRIKIRKILENRDEEKKRRKEKTEEIYFGIREEKVIDRER